MCRAAQRKPPKPFLFWTRGVSSGTGACSKGPCGRDLYLRLFVFFGGTQGQALRPHTPLLSRAMDYPSAAEGFRPIEGLH